MVLVLEVDDPSTLVWDRQSTYTGKVLAAYNDPDVITEDMEMAGIMRNLIASGEISEASIEKWRD